MKILCLTDCCLQKYGLMEGFVQDNPLDEVKCMAVWKYPKEEQSMVVYDEIKSWQPQLVFVEGFPGFDVLNVIMPAKKDLGHIFKFCYWAIEDYINYHQSLPIARVADMVFTTVWEQILEYKKEGIDAELLQFGVNPKFHRQTVRNKDYETDIVLASCNYDRRYEPTYDILLNPIISHGYKIKVWGQFWDDPKRPYNLLKTPEVFSGSRIAYEELPSLYSSAKIVLGVHQIRDSVSQASMRTHEALGCASAYLSFETLYHTKNFIKGTHMEWSNSADETLRIVDDLLKNESKRIRMGREGQKLVYARDNYASKARGIKNTYAIKYNIFNNAPYKSGGV